MPACKHCGHQTERATYSYCSNQCQLDYQYSAYIRLWKLGKVTGSRGINAMNISGHIIRYLREKHGSTCTSCGWAAKNPVTGKVPLEIDHIDGNATNNSESNLRLLCPNCHSLTPSFRNLNCGQGRSWRRLKYLKST
jgi:hypothetical protein